MALDIGERRIGIATSESGIFATPHSVLIRKSKQEDFARLQRLISELKIDYLVIGMPYSLSDPEKIGPQARRVLRYAEALIKTVPIPFEYFDEAYSTVDAETYRVASGRRNIPIDAAAAAVILQNYLDSNRKFPPPTTMIDDEE